MSASPSGTSPSASLLAALRGINPVRLAIGALIVTTLFHLWFATLIDLVPDEAYYWVWSKHPDWSYREKGPGVAWVIAVGTWVFGDTVFGVRFFAVLFSAGIGWQLFRLARRLYDDAIALWCLVLAMIMPMFSGGSILMTVDPLSVFSWAWAANLFWTALHSGKVRHWAALGFVIGLGFLAKFTNGVQMACIGLFLLWSKPHRSLVFSRQTVAMAAAFLVAITPIIYWNSQNGWAQLTSLHSRSGAQSSFGIHPMELLQFIGGELGVISPLVAMGMVVAAFAMLRRLHAELRARFLLCLSLPLAGLFLFFSLNKAGKENWPAPALITCIVLTVVFWRDLIARARDWRGKIWPGLGKRFLLKCAVWSALAISILMSLLLHVANFVPLPARINVLRRAQGWHDFAVHVQQARTQHNATLLIGNSYSTTSMLQFYLQDHPITYMPKKERGGKSQFDHWPGYDLGAHFRALYVTQYEKDPKPVSDAVQRDFPDCKLVDDFQSLHRGRPMNRFRIFLCTRPSPSP